MLHASTQKLIHKLCELTASGDIAWTEGERACSRFETEGYTVEVEADPAAVRVFDTAGREIERADTALLAATPWPGGGGNYAQHVSEMAEIAHRVARGAERAISRILSSLSAPPQVFPPQPAQEMVEAASTPAAPEFVDMSERIEPPVFSTAGGAESEAAMAAAVADMALRLSQAPLEAAPPEPTPEAPALPQTIIVAEAVLAATPDPAPEPAPLPESLPEPPPEPVVATETAANTATARPVRTLHQGPVGDLPPAPDGFGRTRGFSMSARSAPPSKAPASKPVQAPVKITATGLMISGIHATTHQTPRNHTPAPRHNGVSATPHGDVTAADTKAPDPAPARVTGDAYKPWS